MSKALWVSATMVTIILGTGLMIGLAADRPAGKADAQPRVDGDGQRPRGPLADRPAGKFARGARHRLGELVKDLNLTDDQKQQIAKVLKSHKGEILPLVKQVRDDRRALRTAVRAEPIDEKAIRAAAEKLGKDLGDAAVMRAKIRKEIQAILTDAQKAALEKARNDLDTRLDDAITEAEAEQ